MAADTTGPNEFLLQSKRIVLPSGILDGVIHVKDGRIVATYSASSLPASARSLATIDVGNDVVSPGIVDTHAHINEPGRTEWEGFKTATQAAAAGGVTTVVDMPLNSIPPTTTVDGFQQKLASAKASGCSIDYGFWGGVIGINDAELEPLVTAGVLGFKCFMIESGVDEFPCVDEQQLLRALPILKKCGVPLLAHAELDIPSAVTKTVSTSQAYEDYLLSRPKEWENAAIRLLIKLCEQTGARIHVVHLSSADAIPLLSAARQKGLPISAETCPHYLTLCSEEIGSGATQFKCAPPVREKHNQKLLWQGIKEGAIDFIVSDHSPCTPVLKCFETGDFMKAWGGISSLQLGLSLIWSAAKENQLSLNDLARLLSSNTAKFAGIFDRKGEIAVGKDADFVVWNPEESFIIQEQSIFHRHKMTPYLSKKVFGRVKRTYLRGQQIFADGKFTAGLGQPLLKRHS